MGLGVAMAGVAALAVGPHPGLSAEPPAVPQAKDQPKFRYFGSESCADCHAVTKDRPTRSTFALGYVKLNEYLTWSTEDKHSFAFKRLVGKRGSDMARRLSSDPSKPVDVTKPEAGCLGCHSAGKKELDDRNQGVQFNRNEGVSCENCHGPYSGWDTDHRQPYFRSWDAKKRADSGMVDVRVPMIQAGQCLSCHIGNSEEGKVVTHDMYAAGHPPLPSIEVATFCDIIPRHWSLLHEKDDLRKNRPLAKAEREEKEAIRKSVGYMEGDRERTKLAIIGAAVALKTSMKLLSDEARGQGDPNGQGTEWPDYARFDCWSCHHDLKRDSWRQARGFQVSPGRPPISEWPLAIVRLGIDRLEMIGKDEGVKLRGQLESHQKVMLGEVNSRPYGRKVPLGQAAQEFADWANDLVTKLSNVSYDEMTAFNLLRGLVAKMKPDPNDSKRRFADYDEARHIAWTIKILVEDSGPNLKNRAEIEAVLTKLTKGLKLDLPAGQKYEIEDEIGKALKIIGDYEPADFLENIKELHKLINPVKQL